MAKMSREDSGKREIDRSTRKPVPVRLSGKGQDIAAHTKSLHAKDAANRVPINRNPTLQPAKDDRCDLFTERAYDMGTLMTSTALAKVHVPKSSLPSLKNG